PTRYRRPFPTRRSSDLLRRDAEWALAASEGRDVERILSFWTDDAVVLPPGLPPIIGKAALRQYVETSLQVPGFRITWSTEKAARSEEHTSELQSPYDLV